MSALARLLAVALLAAGCAVQAPAPTPVVRIEPAAPPAPPPSRAPGPVTLRNADLTIDMPADARCAPGWTCTMHARPNAFRFFVERDAAGAGLCVEPVKKEPWAIVAQGINDPALRGTRLRFSIATRLTGVTGAGAGPWAQVQPARGQKQTTQKLSSESGDWTTQSVEFDVAPDAITVEVGMMFRGTGRACFGQARLEVLQAAKNPV